jgi:hypothetical protein
VIRRVATLSEIDQHWDWADLMDVNAALDLQDEADRLAAQAAREGS